MPRKCTKRRFSERKARSVLLNAQYEKTNDPLTRRKERRMYYCVGCAGYHLTSQVDQFDPHPNPIMDGTIEELDKEIKLKEANLHSPPVVYRVQVLVLSGVQTKTHNLLSYPISEIDDEDFINNDDFKEKVKNAINERYSDKEVDSISIGRGSRANRSPSIIIPIYDILPDYNAPN